MLREAFEVQVPATSANLGPGFDAVGIALQLPLRASVRPARRFSLDFSGARVPSHGGFAQAIVGAISGIHGSLPAIAIDVRNDIPLGKGLGSSAAAAVLGAAIAQRCAGKRLDRRALAEAAAAIEGHPDNAYAAVYGGAVVSASASRVRLGAPQGLRAIVVVPDLALSTHEARSLLPEHYSREDAAFNAARASLLGAALATGSWSALREAMRDRLHQPYRAARMPGVREALSLSDRGLIGVALSGAGPSVLAIVRVTGAKRIGERIRACFALHGIEAEVLSLGFASRGLFVRGLTA